MPKISALLETLHVSIDTASKDELVDSLRLIQEAQSLSSAERSTLEALFDIGPLDDGDVPSKSARDVLLGKGFCQKVCIKGEQGFNACTQKGFWAVQVIRAKSESIEQNLERPNYRQIDFYSPIVKIKLNQIGRAELDRRYQEITEYTGKEITAPEDSEGRIRCSLMELVYTFGKLIKPSFNLPFDKIWIDAGKIAEIQLHTLESLDFYDRIFRIRLTEFGKQELRKQSQEIDDLIGKDREYIAPIEDEEGFSIWSFADLMMTFGHLMRPGNEMPFETDFCFDRSNQKQ